MFRMDENSDLSDGDAEKLDRADRLFERMISLGEAAAQLDNAAGYNVAVQTMKYAASILNPSKYGTKVTDNQGNVAGYIIETGIRRTGDAGHSSGDVQNGETETAGGSISPENPNVGGQNNSDGVDID